MNQIGFICGLLGILGVCLSLIGSIVPHHFKVLWMLTLSALALFPLVFIVIYWVIKYRTKPFANWLDEKQIKDTAFSAVISIIIVILFLIVSSIIVISKTIIIHTAFWFTLLFFIILTVFSGFIMIKNRMVN